MIYKIGKKLTLAEVVGSSNITLRELSNLVEWLKERHGNGNANHTPFLDVELIRYAEKTRLLYQVFG